MARTFVVPALIPIGESSPHSIQVIQVAVGGSYGAPTFTPNNIIAANGTIIQFQFQFTGA
jgi:hypothetical protein